MARALVISMIYIIEVFYDYFQNECQSGKSMQLQMYIWNLILLQTSYDPNVQGNTLYYYCTAPARSNWNTKQSHFANPLQQNR